MYRVIEQTSSSPVQGTSAGAHRSRTHPYYYSNSSHHRLKQLKSSIILTRARHVCRCSSLSHTSSCSKPKSRSWRVGVFTLATAPAWIRYYYSGTYVSVSFAKQDNNPRSRSCHVGVFTLATAPAWSGICSCCASVSMSCMTR